MKINCPFANFFSAQDFFEAKQPGMGGHIVLRD
jgi:hypothetical protein